MMTERTMTHPKVHLASLGCAKNLVDSERLLGRLATAGAMVGAAPEEADILIINTCGFIGPAVDESLQTIRDYGHVKRQAGGRRLIVMGCLAERDAGRIRSELPDVDVVVGLHSDDEILRACGLAVTDSDDEARLLLTPPHSAYLRISDGCDNGCTYCTIPLIRGPFRSRPPQVIREEAHNLAAMGAQELVIIGQDTTSYGRDREDGIPVHQLLRDLAEIEGPAWLRLLYTHPAHFSDELIDEYASNKKLCPYVDLPLQHLNDDVLRRMGRGVSRDDCLKLIERLRKRIPGIAIRTTFIVGFPGETDAQFEELLALVRELRFEHLGAFAYSREAGTAAHDFSDHLSDTVVGERIRRLMLAQQDIAFEMNEAQIGRTMDLLLDEPTEEDDLWVGRTRFQAPDVDSVTFVSGEDLDVGRMVEARIVGSNDYDLLAEV